MICTVYFSEFDRKKFVNLVWLRSPGMRITSASLQTLVSPNTSDITCHIVVGLELQGSPEEPATGDFLRVLKHITPATNFGSILFLVQHFKCIFYRNKEAKQLVYFVRQTNILLTSISVL